MSLLKCNKKRGITLIELTTYLYVKPCSLLYYLFLLYPDGIFLMPCEAVSSPCNTLRQ